ncbi:hypothetical protein AV530_016234 [Patagioenas fasciata monilis]|uniref:Uncharacterized protein n=1 Tax=Patagioenas fasciata monilis TaxID=372326 RepID=A0A1V4JWH9_PATFA|nr:hypothetical protein AV530_016234 [Patagioenas fasciata monilis]
MLKHSEEKRGPSPILTSHWQKQIVTIVCLHCCLKHNCKEYTTSTGQKFPFRYYMAIHVNSFAQRDNVSYSVFPRRVQKGHGMSHDFEASLLEGGCSFTMAEASPGPAGHESVLTPTPDFPDGCDRNLKASSPDITKDFMFSPVGAEDGDWH